MTWQQREEEKKREKQLRDEAEEKNEMAKKDGKKGKWIVVGKRGRRRLIWVEEKVEEEKEEWV